MPSKLNRAIYVMQEMNAVVMIFEEGILAVSHQTTCSENLVGVEFNRREQAKRVRILKVVSIRNCSAI